MDTNAVSPNLEGLAIGDSPSLKTGQDSGGIGGKGFAHAGPIALESFFGFGVITVFPTTSAGVRTIEFLVPAEVADREGIETLLRGYRI